MSAGKWFSSLFTGSNDTLAGAIPKYGAISDWSVGKGEKSLDKGLNLYDSILSGDQGKIGQVLAPETKAIQDQVGQQKKTTAEFGNRSGGNNAAMQMTGDKARASLNDMVASLLGKAADTSITAGSGLLSQGIGALGNQVDASQIQKQNWDNSLFGLGITKGVGFLEGMGMGAGTPV
jgi:hypothetical protein